MVDGEDVAELVRKRCGISMIKFYLNAPFVFVAVVDDALFE